MALAGLTLLIPIPIVISQTLGDAFNFVAFLVGAAGFLVMIWGLSRRSQKQLHYYEEESSRTWKAGAILAFIMALFFFVATAAAVIVNPGPAFLVSLVLAVIMLLSSRYAIHVASAKRVTERFASKKYKCPNCGNMLERLEKSCLQCGAVVWTIFAPRPGTYQMTRTRGSKKLIDFLEVDGPSSGPRQI